MNRREFLNRSTAATLSLGLSNYLLGESPLDEAVLARKHPRNALNSCRQCDWGIRGRVQVLGSLEDAPLTR